MVIFGGRFKILWIILVLASIDELKKGINSAIECIKSEMLHREWINVVLFEGVK